VFFLFLCKKRCNKFLRSKKAARKAAENEKNTPDYFQMVLFLTKNKHFLKIFKWPVYIAARACRC
jgi:hypothetical protein